MANISWLDERHVVVEVAAGYSITTVAGRLGGKPIDQPGMRPIYLVEVADTATALGVSGKDIVFVEPNRVVRTPEQVNSIRTQSVP